LKLQSNYRGRPCLKYALRVTVIYCRPIVLYCIVLYCIFV